MTDPTTTAPVLVAALVADLGAAMSGPNAGVRVFESWPGPSGQSEMIVLGEVEWEEYGIATIKSGRQHRDEVYDVGFEVFVIGAEGTSPTTPGPARVRAYEILGAVEDVLAEDPVPPPVTVAWLEVRPTAAGPRVFEKGWAYRVAGTIHATARLT